MEEYKCLIIYPCSRLLTNGKSPSGEYKSSVKKTELTERFACARAIMLNEILCLNERGLRRMNTESLAQLNRSAPPHTNAELKPILKYPGGKGRELKYILPAVPHTINRFFEPFVGGGATYFSMGDIQRYYINDISKELIATYRAVQLQNSYFLNILSLLNEDWKLISTLEHISFDLDIEDFTFVPTLAIVKTFNLESFFAEYLVKMIRRKQSYMLKQKSKGNVISEDNKRSIFETVLKSSYYATIRKIYNQNRKDSKIEENTAFYLFVREFCYSSMFRFSQNGDFNVPYGGMSYNSKNFDEKLKYFCSDALRSRLNNTDIYNVDFQNFAEEFKFNSNDFIFVDPPYDTEFSTYDENTFDKKDQKRLASFLRDTKAKWLLIIKDTDFIRSLYPQEDKNLFYQEFNKNYSVSFMNRNDRNVNHLMITNYKEGY